LHINGILPIYPIKAKIKISDNNIINNALYDLSADVSFIEESDQDSRFLIFIYHLYNLYNTYKLNNFDKENLNKAINFDSDCLNSFIIFNLMNKISDFNINNYSIFEVLKETKNLVLNIVDKKLQLTNLEQKLNDNTFKFLCLCKKEFMK
jgi:hypothetical protein